MKRGEIWTVAGGKDYAGKPRPAVIVQDERFEMKDSLTVCVFQPMLLCFGCPSSPTKRTAYELFHD